MGQITGLISKVFGLDVDILFGVKKAFLCFTYTTYYLLQKYLFDVK